jgi:hypothetical protein
MKFSAPATAPVAFGQHQQHVVAQRLLRDVEEGPREIGHAPFPRAGVLVEHPERIPVLGADIVAGIGPDLAAEGLRALPLLADVLALARTERAEEGVEIGVAVVEPVELLAGAAHQAHRRAVARLALGAEGDMQRRDRVVGRKLHRPLHQRGAPGLFPPGRVRNRRPVAGVKGTAI